MSVISKDIDLQHAFQKTFLKNTKNVTQKPRQLMIYKQ